MENPTVRAQEITSWQLVSNHGQYTHELYYRIVGDALELSGNLTFALPVGGFIIALPEHANRIEEGISTGVFLQNEVYTVAPIKYVYRSPYLILEGYSGSGNFPITAGTKLFLNMSMRLKAQ